VANLTVFEIFVVLLPKSPVIITARCDSFLLYCGRCSCCL